MDDFIDHLDEIPLSTHIEKIQKSSNFDEFSTKSPLKLKDDLDNLLEITRMDYPIVQHLTTVPLNQDDPVFKHDQAFIDYPSEREGSAEWPEDFNLFLKEFSNSEKVEQTQDEPLAKTEDQTPKKSTQLDNYVANTGQPEDPIPIDEYMSRWCNTIYRPSSPTPQEAKNLQEYSDYINDFSVRMEGGWLPSENFTHDENLLRRTLGLPPRTTPRGQTPVPPTIRNKIKQGKDKLLKGFGLLNKKNPIQTQIRTLTKTQGFPAL